MLKNIRKRGAEIFLAVYVVLLSAVALFLGMKLPLSFDGGTHMVLSEFYRDVLLNAPRLGFSPHRLYEFGVNYLIHYPKLTITYLPLYHLSMIPFLSLSWDPIAGVLTSVIYFALTSVLIYAIGNMIFKDKKMAIIAVLLFTLSEQIFMYLYYIAVDYSSYFCCFLIIFLFLKALETKKDLYFVLTGVSCFLAFFSRIFAVFPLLSVVAYLALFEKTKKLRSILLVSVPFLLLTAPFLLFYSSVGGLEAGRIVLTEAESLPWTDYGPAAAVFYFIEYAEHTYGVGLAIFAAAAAYLYGLFKRKSFDKENVFLLLWFCSAYLIITYLQNPRYVSYILMPVIFWSSRLFAKLKPAYLVIFLVAFSFAPFFNAYYEVSERGGLAPAGKEISGYLFERGGNIGLLSDEPMPSSVFIYYVSVLDVNKTVFVYRPCFFDSFSNSSEGSLLGEMGKNGITSVVVVRGKETAAFGAIKQAAQLEKSFNAGNYTFDVYSVKAAGETKQKCNYVCAAGKYFCTDLSSPYDVK